MRPFPFSKTALRLAAACALAAPIAAQAGADEEAQQRTLTVVSFGGAYAEASSKAYHQPFTEHTGIAINLDEYTGGRGADQGAGGDRQRPLGCRGPQRCRCPVGVR